ncbi:hypothetical protein C8R45DRAFT_942577 [Mycena sanguinolenta]|nr:hypothetical protein C8R45DRAFT_942577 [Mycena sanguinolenta]
MTRGSKTNKTRARATTQTARLTARWEMKASVRRRLLLQSSVGRNGNAEAACREGVLRAKASYDEDEGEDNGERGEWEIEDPCHLCPVHAERRRSCVEELREEARTERGENSAGGLQIRTRIENNPSSDPRPHIRHTPPEPESPLVKDLECQRTMRITTHSRSKAHSAPAGTSHTLRKDIPSQKSTASLCYKARVRTNRTLICTHLLSLPPEFSVPVKNPCRTPHTHLKIQNTFEPLDTADVSPKQHTKPPLRLLRAQPAVVEKIPLRGNAEGFKSDNTWLCH